MFYHAGDSQQIQNIQINKVIDENEKCVFYLRERTKWTFHLTQYLINSVGKYVLAFAGTVLVPGT